YPGFLDRLICIKLKDESISLSVKVKLPLSLSIMYGYATAVYATKRTINIRLKNKYTNTFLFRIILDINPDRRNLNINTIFSLTTSCFFISYTPHIFLISRIYAL
ncbi:hypothetical protein, partial [Vibrio sp. V23_P3S9T160]|uniref:hypothetical protein n=1 Tax=Vibrio sp. V23_P3S9T160 TaxID=1938675 RepID=UPI001F3CA423